MLDVVYRFQTMHPDKWAAIVGANPENIDNAEQDPYAHLAVGFEIVRVPTWGYRIIKTTT